MLLFKDTAAGNSCSTRCGLTKPLSPQQWWRAECSSEGTFSPVTVRLQQSGSAGFAGVQDESNKAVFCPFLVLSFRPLMLVQLGPQTTNQSTHIRSCKQCGKLVVKFNTPRVAERVSDGCVHGRWAVGWVGEAGCCFRQSGTLQSSSNLHCQPALNQHASCQTQRERAGVGINKYRACKGHNHLIMTTQSVISGGMTYRAGLTPAAACEGSRGGEQPVREMTCWKHDVHTDKTMPCLLVAEPIKAWRLGSAKRDLLDHDDALSWPSS